jgi:CubicO group peptidase (beta-lactamase class C family)
LRKATLRQLLNHCTGLPAWRPFYSEIMPDGRRLQTMPLLTRRMALYEAVHREPLIEPVGTKGVYSDLGFILLGELLQRLTGKDWTRLCHDDVFPRIGCRGLFYMSESGPTGSVSIENHQFAATEQDEWRDRLLRGEVHDEHAALMGGVSAHAGLFGTAHAVLEAVLPWMRAIQGNGSVIDSRWAKEFVRRQDLVPDSSWGLGWDTPSEGSEGAPSSSGRYFSPASFGHLGYAGTSIWADPERDLIVVLLTNRVHPSRKNNAIRQFRPALHDAVIKIVSA